MLTISVPRKGRRSARWALRCNTQDCGAHIELIDGGGGLHFPNADGNAWSHDNGLDYCGPCTRARQTAP